MKLFITTCLIFSFQYLAWAQYTFHQRRLTALNDTIEIYLYKNDSVVGQIKNGLPVNKWTHYFHVGSYMTGNYKGFLGQYTGKWDYFDKNRHLQKSIIYHSIKDDDIWTHSELILDSIGNLLRTKIKTFNIVTK